MDFEDIPEAPSQEQFSVGGVTSSLPEPTSSADPYGALEDDALR